VRNSLNVLKGLLCSLEGLVSCNFNHLGEPLKGVDSLLDFGKTGSSLVILFFFKETIP
jgi:hypothetical protein